MSTPERTAIACRRVVSLLLDRIQSIVDQPGFGDQGVKEVEALITDLRTNVLRIKSSEALISAAPRTNLEPLFEGITEPFRQQVGA